MLKLTGITKDYKIAAGVVHALKGVSLEFRKNEFVCILGASGCGKTTLLNIIGGLDHYTTGDLVIQGKSTKDFKDRDWDVYRNHRIGFIFQTYNLIPHQTVLSNVELTLTIAGVGKEERRERARRALERVGLANELNKLPNQLSGGQMQRVAIARALVNNPDILLADEPTGALDSKTSVEVMELIKEISGERLVIMVTHNPELAQAYATRIVRLKDGTVEDDSDPYSGGEDETEAPAPAASSQPAVPAPEGGKKRAKKPRAKMSFLTSLALSAKNLFTKKGRTIITSVAGSIGIISVCLVLALSSGFNNYIRRTEEDMLSYYPVEISETTFDLNAVMSNVTSSSDMPDLQEIGDRVYVNSFLTHLAQGIAVTNNISESYIDYLEAGKEEHPDWISAIQYGYGVSFVDNFFTAVEVGGVLNRETGETTPVETRNLSLSELKSFYTDELVSLAPEYSALVRFADFFGNILGVMPGTEDPSSEEYSEFVRSQYDLLDPETMHFPENENEAVLVVGSDRDATDLTLAQLGFLPEKKFMDLFNMGKEENGTAQHEFIPFEDVLAKQYVLYYNDSVYSQKKTGELTDQSFSYSGSRDALNTAESGKELGIPIRISAVVRLKEGRTYGCLTDGLNITEAALRKYISVNKESAIAKWVQSEEARVPESLLTLMQLDPEEISMYRSPSTHLNAQYTGLDLGSVRLGLSSAYGTGFLQQTGAAFTGMGLPFPLTGDEISREGALAFFAAYGSFIAPQLGANGAAIVAEMMEEIGDLSATFTEAELATALGGPLVADRVESALGFKLAGTLFVSYLPDTIVRLLGGNDAPNDVFIYPADFDAKENVLSYLDAWNTMEGREETDKITYTDRVGLLMGMMQTMLNVITIVLVAFTSISLVVSSVMIGIITYVSVVERVKEIGVLRSLGARKHDIRNLFNAETFIIGLAAGLIGVGVTYLLSIVVNLIIFSLTGISGIAALPPLSAFIMVCVSVALTLISGLIPAQAAAKKDPVIALRTE